MCIVLGRYFPQSKTDIHFSMDTIWLLIATQFFFLYDDVYSQSMDTSQNPEDKYRAAISLSLSLQKNYSTIAEKKVKSRHLDLPPPLSSKHSLGLGYIAAAVDAVAFVASIPVDDCE